LRGALFADVGSVWGYEGATLFPAVGPFTGTCPAGGTITGSLCLADSNSIRASIGGSVIWASPFGPLRFDIGYPLLKEPWDKKQLLRFGAGGRF
jgi:outer membrane protein insertion porin family